MDAKYVKLSQQYTMLYLALDTISTQTNMSATLPHEDFELFDVDEDIIVYRNIFYKFNDRILTASKLGYGFNRSLPNVKDTADMPRTKEVLALEKHLVTVGETRKLVRTIAEYYVSAKRVLDKCAKLGPINEARFYQSLVSNYYDGSAISEENLKQVCELEEQKVLLRNFVVDNEKFIETTLGPYILAKQLGMD